MVKQGENQRVIVYIDGYNLYHGMESAFGNKYKWLNLQAFSESFLRPGMNLVSVKYFTAITKNGVEARQRQEIYLKALQAHCDRLEVFFGRFLLKPKRCSRCGYTEHIPEEKKTDVNISCQILNDVHLDRYDCCYVVSGDSDLVPPLMMIKQNHPNKHAVVAHPPRRKSRELCEAAAGWFSITKRRFRDNQLPDEIVSTHAGQLTRPAQWRRP